MQTQSSSFRSGRPYELPYSEKLEMCKRGERFKERIYVPPKITENTKCEVCGDVGYRFFWFDGYEYAEECACNGVRRSEAAIRNAGIQRNMTFDKFFVNQPFQKEILAKAKEYANGGYLTGQWFYIGGQAGCGKTHICTAIVEELLKKSVECYYMMWRDEAVQLKAIVNEHAEYHERLSRLCKVPVLYIDDFWKTQQGQKPTQADVNLAFQIINMRYQNRNCVTLVSCELSAEELMQIDEATGSRIAERSKAYYLYVAKDKNKNYRLRG